MQSTVWFTGLSARPGNGSFVRPVFLRKVVEEVSAPGRIFREVSLGEEIGLGTRPCRLETL